jgi:hypothetical protein
MKTVQVELISDESNNAVLRLQGRRFAGMLIQGDSMWILYKLAQNIYLLCQETEQYEASDISFELIGLLRGYLRGYERALSESGLPLPYNGSVTDSLED